jgi:hypothetical protein
MQRWVAWHNRLLDHDAMARDALIDSPLVHGTACLRRNWLERVGGWTQGDGPEDLDLWLRLMARGARFDKLPRVLYAWRQHAESATRRDPRYAQARFDDLRLAVLDAGLLSKTRTCTLVGVGEALRRWRAHLAPRIEHLGVVHQGRPPSPPVKWHSPSVLVFSSDVARERWRRYMAQMGFTEGIDFVFVA